MSRIATLAEMRTRAYQRGDFESKTDRFPTPEVTALLNESIADLWDRILRARGTSYGETSQDYTTVAGQTDYTLPSNFMTLVAVEYNSGNGKFPLEEFQRLERAYLTDPAQGWRGTPYYYNLVGSNLTLLPTPSVSGHTCTIRYVKAATKLVNDGDTFDGVDGWEEWAVVDTARKMATKERHMELVQVLTGDLDRLSERIRALAGSRDRALPRRVVDVRGRRTTNFLRRRW